MNKDRRKRLESIKEKLDKIREELDDVRSEEQESYENIPVNMQGSDRAYKMYGNIYILEDAVSSLDETFSNLDEIIYS